MKKQPDFTTLVFTTNFGTTVLNADGSTHFLTNPREAEELWQSLNLERTDAVPASDGGTADGI